MFEILLGIGRVGFELVRPFIAPLLAYWKGRSDAKRDSELEAHEHFNDVSAKADAARRRARRDGVRIEDDPNNRD